MAIKGGELSALLQMQNIYRFLFLFSPCYSECFTYDWQAYKTVQIKTMEQFETTAHERKKSEKNNRKYSIILNTMTYTIWNIWD